MGKVVPETRGFWCDSRPEIRDTSYGRDSGPETRDPKGGTQDPRPGTQLIGWTWNSRPRTLKVGPEILDT